MPILHVNVGHASIPRIPPTTAFLLSQLRGMLPRMELKFKGARRELCQILRCLCDQREKHVVFVEVRELKSGFTTKGNLMSTTMTDVQSFTLTAAPEDSVGAPAIFGAMPTFAVAPVGALVLTPAAALNADGSASVTVANASPPVLGASVITLTGNGALAAGGPDPADVVTGTYSVSVVAGEASQVVFTATTPAP